MVCADSLGRSVNALGLVLLTHPVSSCPRIPRGARPCLIGPSRAGGGPRESLLSMRSVHDKSVKQARDFVRPESPRTLPAEGLDLLAGRTNVRVLRWLWLPIKPHLWYYLRTSR